jgi:hypothetical protein
MVAMMIPTLMDITVSTPAVKTTQAVLSRTAKAKRLSRHTDLIILRLVAKNSTVQDNIVMQTMTERTVSTPLAFNIQRDTVSQMMVNNAFEQFNM